MFSFDPTRRSFGYSVRVTGTPAANVYGISLDRVTDAKKGPVVRVLGRPGVANVAGQVKLADDERRDLVDGKLALVVYTVEQPRGTIKAALTPR